MLAEPQSARSVLSNWAEIVKNIFEIVAISGGALWTYFNYFRGRTYHPRLECSVDASIEKRSGRSFLRAVARVRNIGLSRVPIQQKGTALLIFSAQAQDPAPLFPTQVRWHDPVAAFDVFVGQKWVEPSEPIAESLMVALPHAEGLTYKVALKVVSGQIWWTAETIVGDT